VDERDMLEDGSPNPAYHSYLIHEPHAEVVRIIFDQLAMPGMTPTRVARYCYNKGIVFTPFPPELDMQANKKVFSSSRRNTDGSWPVTIGRVRRIATNPAYIGWKLWSGEVVSKDVYPPIIDESVFWTVQARFGSRDRPKKEFDPFPLAGLLYCGNHDTPQRMTYINRSKKLGGKVYYCRDQDLGIHCTSIAAHILDDPISEAVISRLTCERLPERMLQEYADEYEVAKEQAASYRREMKRLEAEVENLRGNLVAKVMSADQLEWLDGQIQERLAYIEKLADLESQPIGAMIGRPMPGQVTIESVQAFLENLNDEWRDMPNGLKNAVLRLLLDRVTIWHKPATIRVKKVSENSTLLSQRNNK
jgi:hypothetical protein